MVPVQHQHVQRNLTTTVPNRLKLDLLRPSGLQLRRRIILLRRSSDIAQSSHKDQSRVTALQQQWHESMRQHIRPSYIRIIRHIKAISKTRPAFDISKIICCPSIIDQDIDVVVLGFDQIIRFINGLIAG